MKPKIILASASPRRKELLEMMGLEFKVVKSNYNEDAKLKLKPEELVKLFAEGKASDVAKKVKSGIIIGSDTIVAIGNKILGKPKGDNDAFKMLKSVSGKNVDVYSGLAIIDARTGKKLVAYEKTRVKMHKMSNEEIRSYVRTNEPTDCAGAFAIQRLGSIFVSKIDGCYFNVVGLPVHLLFKSLKKFKVNLFECRKWKKGTAV